jgi:hypothetical protein
MCGKVLQSFSVAPFCRMTASQRFGRSMIHIRSVEQLSCLTCRVTEADRPSSVEKCTPRMLIFNFGNRSKSGELMSGLWGRWGSTSQLYLSNNSRTSLPRWGLTEVMRNPPGGNSTFVQAFSQNAVGRCSRNSSTMCNFITCRSAVFLQDLEHTFRTLVISRRSGSS